MHQTLIVLLGEIGYFDVSSSCWQAAALKALNVCLHRVSASGWLLGELKFHKELKMVHISLLAGSQTTVTKER